MVNAIEKHTKLVSKLFQNFYKHSTRSRYVSSTNTQKDHRVQYTLITINVLHISKMVSKLGGRIIFGQYYCLFVLILIINSERIKNIDVVIVNCWSWFLLLT